jgi:uncharacterized protein (TIGR02466 family)
MSSRKSKSLPLKSIFPTQVYQGPLGLDPNTHLSLKQTALKLPQMDTAGVKWCRTNYVNGYTSYGSMSNLHEQFSPFEKLKAKLDRVVARYTQALGIQVPTGELVLSNLWVNVMPKDCYHAFHIHPLSVVSGTYYVSTGSDSKGKAASPLRIEDPRASRMMAAPPRPMRLDLQPKNGDVILFESWLSHEVPPHSMKQERISVSFNYDWINR